jgi:hypothetical protein
MTSRPGKIRPFPGSSRPYGREDFGVGVAIRRGSGFAISDFGVGIRSFILIPIPIYPFYPYFIPPDGIFTGGFPKSIGGCRTGWVPKC